MNEDDTNESCSLWSASSGFSSSGSEGLWAIPFAEGLVELNQVEEVLRHLGFLVASHRTALSLRQNQNTLERC